MHFNGNKPGFLLYANGLTAFHKIFFEMQSVDLTASYTVRPKKNTPFVESVPSFATF